VGLFALQGRRRSSDIEHSSRGSVNAEIKGTCRPFPSVSYQGHIVSCMLKSFGNFAAQGDRLSCDDYFHSFFPLLQ
jgi:hypothetical protein